MLFSIIFFSLTIQLSHYLMLNEKFITIRETRKQKASQKKNHKTFWQVRSLLPTTFGSIHTSNHEICLTKRREDIPKGGFLPVAVVNLEENIFLSDVTTPLNWPRSCPSKLVNDHISSYSNHSTFPTPNPKQLLTPTH